MPLAGKTTHNSRAAIGMILFVFAIFTILNKGAQ